MQIAILCEDGSPLGVTCKTIWGDHQRVGVGGSELALLTMCEEWTKIGHEVILFNTPWEGGASPFEQRPTSAFNTNDPYDVLIVHRTPNSKSDPSKAHLKVWWSHDQRTQGSFGGFAPKIDKIVVISKYHQQFFKEKFGIQNAIPIPIPVRLPDYEGHDVKKIPHRLLFASVPARGLDNVWRMWDRICQEAPDDMHLSILSDYRLWGCAPSDGLFRGRWAEKSRFSYRGAVARAELIKEQLAADILFYPSNYDELFAVTVAEALVAGAYPITSGIGALSETNLGTVIDVNADDPRNDVTFVRSLIEFLNDDVLLERERQRAKAKAIELYAPDAILKQWEEKIFS